MTRAEYFRAWREANREHVRQKQREWRAANREKTRKAARERARKRWVDNPEAIAAASAKWRSTLSGRATALLRGAVHRARARGIACTITREWVLQRITAGVCEVTGIEFVIQGGKGRSPWAPSLDQIQPQGGYTPENTRVVVSMLNVAKGAHSDEDVMRLARALVKKERENG